MLDKVIWITWEKQIRNKSISSLLGVELFEVIINASRPVRYLKSFSLTLHRVLLKRPRVVIAPNPSIVLGYSLLLLKGIFGFHLVTDAHLGGVRAYNGNRFFQKALDIYNSRADLVIVTNEGHAKFIRSLGGRAFVCQDPLPVLPKAKKIEGYNFDKSIFFICSFDVDEPFRDVFEASNILRDRGYSLFVSGSYGKAGIDPDDFPGVKFLGYIPSEEFYGYLKQCALVIDLTDWDDCLVCGAYEALSAGKPLVISDKPALKKYFGSAAVYTEHTPASIAGSIVRAYEGRESLKADIEKWVKENNAYMASRIDSLRSLFLDMVKAKP